jgi:DNA-binding GntR family transcriptional regulator
MLVRVTIRRPARVIPTRTGNRRLDIAAYIRSEIFNGDLRPGTKVDQDAIASATRSSRIAVREALIVLEREGLVSW